MEDSCRPPPQLKIIMVGDCNVGKSSLLERLHFESFEEATQATVGAQFVIHDMVVDQRPLKLLVWDTAGQERFRSLSHSYYRHTDGALLVFDQSDAKSYDSVMNYWRSELCEKCPDIAVVVVANKSDRPPDVQMDDVQRDCGMYNLPLLETSCKDGAGVERVFEQLAREVMMRLHQDPSASMGRVNGGGSDGGDDDPGLTSFMLQQQASEPAAAPYFACCNVF